MPTGVPHPVPYQGSKRRLAPRILALLPPGVGVLHEPFAGSAALSLAALHAGAVRAVALNDVNAPLMSLWHAVRTDPRPLADGYAALWRDQQPDPVAFYGSVRTAFNVDPQPHRLLFLLARCVKAAVRYNARGEFNQSPDRRRHGTHPDRMRAHLLGAHELLARRSTITATDYRAALAGVRDGDVVYLDPPYQGVSTGRDGRYLTGLAPGELAGTLHDMVRRGVMLVLSYDGRCGDRSYGAALPASLGLTRLELDAGRSASATLHGRAARTVESLYLSPALVDRLSR
ncbi:MAG: DNA adenine methylase [Frankiaceae bacterium]